MEKREHIDETRSFPVVCRISQESQVIKACIIFKFSWPPLDDTTEVLVYYSKPFPDGDHVNKFRVKLTCRPQKSSWFIYITSWKPVTLLADAIITYKVKISETNLTQNEAKTLEKSKLSQDYKTKTTSSLPFSPINQQHFNTWMLMHQSTDMQSSKSLQLLFEIKNIFVEEFDSIQRDKFSWLTLLFDSRDHRTVELVGKESCKVEVLQQALSSSSEVFTRMFAENTSENLQWKESKENRVLLKDMDMQDLTELKAYLYKSAAPKKSAAKLFALANVYQMEHLKFICAEELYAQLTPKNAIDALKLASHFEYKPLIRALWLFYDEHCLHLE